MTSTHHISCIGGGTGLFTLITGLKEVLPEARLSAVVTMMDSGGSTGRLRDEYGYLPPGDIRKCLVAFSNASDLRKLMEYRFPEGKKESPLAGHSFGNLWLTALKDLTPGSMEEKEWGAISAMADILRLKNRMVYPVTLQNCHVCAKLSDGQIIKGEANIDVPKHDANLRIEEIYLEPAAIIFKEARKVLLSSDVIVIGPGDLYTSIMPNLVVQGFADTLKEAQLQGTKILCIVNTMTKHGETDGFTASTFVNRIKDALGMEIDAVIMNDGKPTEQQLGKYRLEDSYPVEDDVPATQFTIRTDLMSETEYARHDPMKLGKAITRAVDRLEALHVWHRSV